MKHDAHQVTYSKHVSRHKKPFTCTYSNCRRRTYGFATNNDLIRHQRTVHGEFAGGRNYVCHHEPCSTRKLKLWPRADNFRAHLKRIHKVEMTAEDDLQYYVHHDTDDRGKESDSQADTSSPTGSIPMIQENDAPSIDLPLPSESSEPTVTSSNLPAGASLLAVRGAEVKDDTRGQRNDVLPESLGAEFAAQLFKRAIWHPLDSATSKVTSRQLSKLLKRYAQMAGYKSPGNPQRDILLYSHDFQK